MPNLISASQNKVSTYIAEFGKLSDMADQEVPKVSKESSVPPVTLPTATTGRCHWCGYQLQGLPIYGNCPECGKEYTEKSATRLQPWPNALKICIRLGWPIAGLMLAGVLIVSGNEPNMFSSRPSTSSQQIWFIGSIIGYAMIVAVGINSYFQVRSMLKRSLPEKIRTRGPVAIWRTIGTAICVIILLVFVGFPLVFWVGCLI